ncbi:hypothetical protein CCR75_003130 [Bremia lactucae]|uniref:Uncharacterized protein n=1 Tax=Bremia lactucae TaxID=4779 RepID=A0A976FIA0_BRELC|nr:hypothetical protein CCR75_003130 [Bremia lactucae]
MPLKPLKSWSLPWSQSSDIIEKATFDTMSVQSSAYRLLYFVVVYAALIMLTWTGASAAQTSNASVHATPHLDWPSLKLHFTMKRNTMRIHSQSEFDVYANPIVSEDGFKVLYDGYVEFIEGSTRTRYTLLGGVAYSTTSVQNRTLSAISQCLDPKGLPPFMDLLTALNDATPALKATSEGSNIECTMGQVLMVKAFGLTLAACSSGLAGISIYGSDIEIQITYLKNRVLIAVPHVLGTCAVATKATEMSDIAIALLTGGEIPNNEERNLNLIFGLSSTTCSCKSVPRPCLFIHGLGIDFAEVGLQDSFDWYWGNLTDHAPCCTEFKYMIWNSIETSWRNSTLQQNIIPPIDGKWKYLPAA